MAQLRGMALFACAAGAMLAAQVAEAAHDSTQHGLALRHHRYIIVGAGPGGLQTAHYLQSAGQDYLVLEKSDHAGSFFTSYPRWRQLISINKPHTGREDSFDFNARHDWNSLLSEESHVQSARQEVPCPAATSAAAMPGMPPPSSARGSTANLTCYTSSWSSTDESRTMASVDPTLLFRHYTDTYYPEAPKLAWFLQAWANGTLPRGPPLRISYNTRVVRVDRPAGYVPKPSPVQPPPMPMPGEKSGDGTDMPPMLDMEEEEDAWPRLAEVALGQPRFVLTVQGPDGTRTTLSCTYLIWAGGLQEPVKPHGVNTMEAVEKGWVKTYATASTRVEDYVNKSVLLLGRGNAAFEFANHVLGVASYVHLVGQRRKRISQAVETHYPGDVRHIHSNLLETYLLKSMDGMAEVFLETLSFQGVQGEDGRNRTSVVDTRSGGACRKDSYGRPASRCLFRRPYDHVIVCPGWRMARGTDMFSPSTQPALYTNGKHPSVTPRYESTNVPGLFFAGNLAHAMDFKKSSGGFIHGFRYTARALHRELMEEEQAAAAMALARGVAVPERSLAASSSASAAGQAAVTPTGAPASAVAPAGTATMKAEGQVVPPEVGAGWPRRLHAGLRAATEALLRRINHAAGPYQMFGGLSDVFVLPPLPASSAVGYSGPGSLAPFVEPWSFLPPTAARANKTSGSTGFLPWAVRPAGEPATTATRKRSDAILDSAMTGWLLEEVPARLVEHKAPGWAAQLVGALGLDARISSGLGTKLGAIHALGSEYITLTLEFGTGAGPLPGELAKQEAASMALDKAQDKEDAGWKQVRARSELARDPYSLLRANVGVHNPEQSHFLHPVLRYFHTGAGTPESRANEWVHGVASPTPLYPGGRLPLAEVHLAEDFWIDWTSHSVHVLALARFLQEVASKRALAALAIQKAADPASAAALAASSSAAPTLPTGPAFVLATSGGAVPPSVNPLSMLAMGPSLAAQSAFTLSTAWTASRRRGKHAETIGIVADHDGAVLYYKGKRSDGGEGWFHSLSVAAADEVFSTGPNAFLVHLLDPDPRPIGQEEAAWTAAWSKSHQERLKSAAGQHFDAPTVSDVFPLPALTPEQEAARGATLARFEAKWRKASALLPGLPIITVPCRSGGDRWWANSMLKDKPLRPAEACGSRILLLFMQGSVVPGMSLDGQAEVDAIVAAVKAKV